VPVYNSFYLVDQKIDPRLLQIRGPIIPVEVGVPAKVVEIWTHEGKTIPKPITGFALLDTGASISAVDREAFETLGIPPVGKTNVATPSGSAEQLVYPARFGFPGTTLPEISYDSILGSVLGTQGIVALLGRDVLCRMVVTFNGPAGLVTIAY